MKGRKKRKGRREGDPTPALLSTEKPCTVRTSWPAKVRGNQAGREPERSVDKSSALPHSSSTPRQPEQWQQTSRGSDTWQEKGGIWQQRPWELTWDWDAHTGTTWAEEVELTQEVWYATDGTVLGVGLPSPSSAPWLTLPQPSPPSHAHTDRYPFFSSTCSPSQRRRGVEMQDSGPEKSGSSSSLSLSLPNHSQRKGESEVQRDSREGEYSDRRGNKERNGMEQKSRNGQEKVNGRKEKGVTVLKRDQGNRGEGEHGMERERTEKGINLRSEQRNEVEKESTTNREVETQRNDIYLEGRNKESTENHENANRDEKNDDANKIEHGGRRGRRRRMRRENAKKRETSEENQTS